MESETEERIFVLPPRIRDLNSFPSSSTEGPDNVWEISVPSTNSLYWSLLISYLMQNNINEQCLQKLTGDGKEKKDISSDKASNQNFMPTDIAELLHNFNPFLNKNALYYEEKMQLLKRVFETSLKRLANKKKTHHFKRVSEKRLKQLANKEKTQHLKEVSNIRLKRLADKEKTQHLKEVSEIQLKQLADKDKTQHSKEVSDIQLKRSANKKKVHGAECSDEHKLEVACEMLNCSVKVFFPEKNTVLQYEPKLNENRSGRITIFQYENQTHGKEEGINIFRFAMDTDRANLLKIEALKRILKRANVFSQKKIISIMENPENHGDNFLKSIFGNNLHPLLKRLYKSPYIAFKLSEAGFNMNPLETNSETLSSFAFLLEPGKREYFDILYEYATQCQLDFEKSMTYSDKVIQSLKEIQIVLENDERLLNRKKSVTVLQQYVLFNKYQQRVTEEICNIRKKINAELPCSNNDSTIDINTQVIRSILENYLEFFYYQNDSSKQYRDYPNYYLTLDYKTFLYLFNNLHAMKKEFQVKGEDIYNELETNFFLCFVYTKYSLENRKYTNSDLFQIFRVNKFQQSIKKFLEKIESTAERLPPNKIKDDIIRNSLSSLHHRRDECVISKVMIYVDAAINAPLDEDVTKGALVIERTLQIIGESVKPSKTEKCIVPYLLSAIFPNNLRNTIMLIRDKLSHTKNSPLENKMTVLREKDLFKGLQDDIIKVRDEIENIKHIHILNIEGRMIDAKKTELRKSTNIKEDGTFGINLLFRLEDILISYKEKECAKNCIYAIKILSHILSAYYDISCETRQEINILEKNCTQIEENLSELKADETIKDIIQKFKLQRPKIEGFDTYSSFRYIETFYDKLMNKQPFICENENSELEKGLNSVYEECGKAIQFFDCIKFPHTYTENQVESYLKKLPLDIGTLRKFRESIKNRDEKAISHYVKKAEFSEEDFRNEVVEKILKGHLTDSHPEKFAMRLFSRKPMVYESINLTKELQVKLDNHITKKIKFLLERINVIKSVLIDDDDRIKHVWLCSKSKEAKDQAKFLMRQRYIREIDVQACVEMAFADCLNILYDKKFPEIYEKSCNLFREVNLIKVITHYYHLMECVSSILEDDLPADIVNKCLELIECSEVIENILQSITISGCVDCDSFEEWIDENNPDIKNCSMWQKFILLTPLACYVPPI